MAESEYQGDIKNGAAVQPCFCNSLPIAAPAPAVSMGVPMTLQGIRDV